MYFNGGRYESTDNAELETGLVGIAADVSGKVIAIDVHENEQVRAGQVLFRIDPASAQAAVDAAAAQLAAARAAVGSTRADYDESTSDLGNARDRLTYAQQEAQRQKELLAEGIASRSQYDQAELAVRTAKDDIAAAEAKAASRKAALAGGPTGAVDDQPAVRRAAAALESAKLDLMHTVVHAPRDGVVTKVNQLQLGSYVTASRPVFMLAGTQFWVEANFKENQLEYMRVGQPASVTIDAFPGVTLKGHVASFSPGTGNSFSILPAENATGNWVKVVQRLPVEVALDEVPQGLPLHAGLSAEVEVDTGHKRHLFGPDTPPSAPATAAVTQP
ncbi:MAG: HlyD family secretion protein [Sphingomonadales bacterium]|nr:HlyD family secretion protein [Sphingomonadales bacterium]